MSLAPRRRAGTRSTASATTSSSVDRAPGSCRVSATCSRDRSTISWTSLVSRARLRPASARRTGRPPRGRRLASSTASASSDSAADRRLQLVADVGDEVAADLLDPAGLGAVLDEQQHVRAAERRDPRADHDRRPPAERAAGQLELAPRGSRRRGRTCAGQVDAARRGPARRRGPGRRRPRPGWPLTTGVGASRRRCRSSAGRRARRRRPGGSGGRLGLGGSGAAARSEQRTAAHGDGTDEHAGQRRRASRRAVASTRLRRTQCGGMLRTPWPPSRTALARCSPGVAATVHAGWDLVRATRTARPRPHRDKGHHARRLPRGARQRSPTSWSR